MLNINCKYIYLLLTGAGLKDLPSEILVQIFQYLTIQDCLRGVGRVCRRFQGLIEYTGEVWRTLETDVEVPKPFRVLCATQSSFENLD